MRGIALTQRKGGSGKTALSHALALGASWHNVPAYLMHTDNREPLKVNGRPYMYYDARKPETLQTLVNAAINTDGLCIIDSAGNRPELKRSATSSIAGTSMNLKPASLPLADRAV